MSTLLNKPYYCKVNAVQVTRKVIKGWINGTIAKPTCLYMFGLSTDSLFETSFVRLSLQTVSGHTPVFEGDWLVFNVGETTPKIFSDSQFRSQYRSLCELK